MNKYFFSFFTSASLSACFFLFSYLRLTAATPEVIKYQGTSASLESRWEWAWDKRSDMKAPLWIAYSTEIMMEKGSTIGSHYKNHNRQGHFILKEIISGTANDWKSDGDAAKKALKEWENNKTELVSKELAFLFLFPKNANTFNEASNTTVSNIHLTVDLKKKSIIWLGKTSLDESVSFLMKKFKASHDKEILEDLIAMIAFHKDQPQVTPFLKHVIENKYDEELREDAVFWLGEQTVDDIIPYLSKLASNDRSSEVREQAIFALSRIESTEAEDALIRFARSSADQETREEAVFWLGERASNKVVAALEDIAYNAEELEIKEKAVFALSELEDNEGVPILIEIANTHKSKEIRKKAIFWLGQSEDPRALEAIIKIVKSN